MVLSPLFAPGGLGSPELIIILLIAVLLFGANKIPKLARSTGQAIGEFQRGRQELEEELEEVQDAAAVDTDTAPTTGTTDQTTAGTTGSGTDTIADTADSDTASETTESDTETATDSDRQ